MKANNGPHPRRADINNQQVKPSFPSSSLVARRLLRGISDQGGHPAQPKKHPGYLDEQLRPARPKVPSDAAHQRALPQPGAATWRKRPHATRDVQEQQGEQIYAVIGSGHDEISPMWEADCPGVPSPYM
jgi:hypothetical protein